METDKLSELLDSECGALRGHFTRDKGWRTACEYVKGLLSKTERKNGWQLAETFGLAAPYKFQHLLGRASWDEGKVRDHNAALALKSLGQGGTLVFDETGFLKKGKESAGVKRQYSGTAGRVENCQIGVFACYRTANGHALVDKELYVPQDWIDDPARCAKAGIPAGRPFRTKPELATEMANRLLASGFAPRWATADEAYGRDPDFRKNLEDKGISYVLAVPKDSFVRVGLRKRAAEDQAKDAAPEEWKRLSCGSGTKGERLYDWLLLERSEPCPDGFGRFLLVRRSLSDPNDLAYYLVFCKQGTSLQEIVSAAGERWAVEECFEMAKGETGLDHYEVRSFVGWNRHVTLSMFALTLLRVAQGRLSEIPKKNVGSMDEFKKKRLLPP